TNAEDEDAKPDERNHYQHDGCERIQKPSQTQCLVAEGEPREILNGPESGHLQRRQERKERHYERGNLSSDRQQSCTFVSPVRQTQNYQRSRERHRRNQPEMIDDPATHPLSWSRWSK